MKALISCTVVGVHFLAREFSETFREAKNWVAYRFVSLTIDSSNDIVKYKLKYVIGLASGEGARLGPGVSEKIVGSFGKQFCRRNIGKCQRFLRF